MSNLIKLTLASVAQFVGALSCKPKGHRFDSQSGHTDKVAGGRAEGTGQEKVLEKGGKAAGGWP